MNLTVSGTKSAIQVRRHGILAHIPCHSAIIRVTGRQAPLDIHAVLTPSPFPCWLIGAKGKASGADGLSVEIEDEARVEIVVDEGGVGDRMELF